MYQLEHPLYIPVVLPVSTLLSDSPASVVCSVCVCVPYRGRFVVVAGLLVFRNKLCLCVCVCERGKEGVFV